MHGEQMPFRNDDSKAVSAAPFVGNQQKTAR
jgi:hypothetical protein